MLVGGACIAELLLIFILGKTVIEMKKVAKLNVYYILHFFACVVTLMVYVLLTFLHDPIQPFSKVQGVEETPFEER